MDIAVYLTCLIPIRKATKQTNKQTNNTNACANILTVPVLSDYDFLRIESLQLSISVVFFFCFFLQMH